MLIEFKIAYHRLINLIVNFKVTVQIRDELLILKYMYQPM